MLNVVGLVSQIRVRILNLICTKINQNHALKVENIFKMETVPIAKNNNLL